jgi:replicative DNA helicase
MLQYEEIERAILNCLIIEPDLFKNIKVSEKHFKKHRRFYIFIKEYYDTFGKFDISLLKSTCKNPGEALDYIAEIIDTTSIAANFDLYQERMLKMYENFEKIEEIHQLEHKLYTRAVTLDEFKNEIQSILGRTQ